MSGVCPKCGREADADAFVCGGCDFILDASFLGDDITDNESESRPGRGGEFVAPPSYGDALILGDLDDDEVGSFATQDTGLATAGVTHARIYVGGAMQQLLNPRTVPEPAALLVNKSLKFTPFERHVMGFVDGVKSVAEILKKSGLDEHDFFTAMATLADKGFLQMSGAEPSVADDIDIDDDLFNESTGIIEKVSEQNDVFSSSVEQLSYFDSLLSKEREEPAKDDDAFAAREESVSRAKKPPLPALDDEADAFESGAFDESEARSPESGAFDRVFSSINDLDPAEGPGFFDENVADKIEEQPTRILEDVNSLPTAEPLAPLTMDPDELSLMPLDPVEVSSAQNQFLSENDAAVDEFIPLDSLEGEPVDALPLPGFSEEGDPISISIEMDAVVAEAPDAKVPLAQIELKKQTPPPPPISVEMSAEGLLVHEEEEHPDDVASAALPYAMRSKAEKLFEDAEKDAAAGRYSSALMNAKLALLHNPHMRAAKSAIVEWQNVGQPKNAAAERERLLVDEAQAAEARGDYITALECLDRAKEISPGQAAIYNLQGVILATRLKRFHEASEVLMRAVELDPSNTTYKNNLGKILAKEDDAKQKSKKGGGFFSKKDEKNEKIVVKKLRPKGL